MKTRTIYHLPRWTIVAVPDDARTGTPQARTPTEYPASWRRRGVLLACDLLVFYAVTVLGAFGLLRLVTIAPKSRAFTSWFMLVVALAVVGRLSPPTQEFPRLIAVAGASFVLHSLLAPTLGPPGVHWWLVLPLAAVGYTLAVVIAGGLAHRLRI